MSNEALTNVIGASVVGIMVLIVAALLILVAKDRI